MQSKLKFATGLGMLFISACGGNSAKDKTDGAAVAAPSTDMRVEHVQSKDGSVQIDHVHVSDAQRAAARNEYRRTNLVQLPVDAKYNATVFHINDESIPEYKNKAFIAPKLYSYGTQDGGRLMSGRNRDGTVTLSFNVILLDGISSKAQTPAGSSTEFEIPAPFKIKDPEGLRSVLQSKFGADDQLAALPGCPKKLTLIAAGHDYDVTPRDLETCDSIQLNVPISVVHTFSEEEARMILEIGLYANIVDLRAVYETKVSYPITKVTVKFDRSKIYSELKAELGVKAWVVDADVKIATTKVIQNQLMTVVTQGDVPAYVDNLVEKVTNQFFEPFVPNPNNPEASPCGDSARVCMRLSSTSLAQSSTMEFTWASESDLLSGQNYITTTKLKATPPNVRIGSEACDQTHTHIGDCNRLTSGASSRETGLTVVSGNSISIEPDYMVRERRTILAPTTIHSDRQVCVTHHEVCHRDNDTCHGRGCLDLKRLAQPQDCSEVCDSWQNQWVDVTNYSTAPDSDEEIHSPVGQLQELYDGLAFRFRWHDQITNQEKNMECPLSSFPRIGDGRSLIVRVMNMPSCAPFTGLPGETPMLHLVNHISFPQQYLVGQQVTRWDGTVLERPTYETFNPKVDFAGTLTILGYSFESASSSGSL